MNNLVNVEIDAVKAEIEELKVKEANYLHQYEVGPDNMKIIFLELVKEVTSLRTQLERQKAALIERTPSPMAANSRPITPFEQDTSISRPSTPIYYEQLQAEDMERYSQLQNYLRCMKLPNKKWVGCVTVISDRYAITNAHIAVSNTYDAYRRQCNKWAEDVKAKKSKMDTELQQGDSIKEWVKTEEHNLLGKLIVVYKIDDDNSQVETEMIHVDIIVDLVVLYAARDGLLDPNCTPLELGTAQHGNNYIVLGLPISANNGHQGLSMLKGNLANASGKAHKKGYIFGAYGADHGYSGGPVIRLGVNNDLLGIAVSGTRDGQQLVQIIPANKFPKIFANDVMLDDAQNEDDPTPD